MRTDACFGLKALSLFKETMMTTTMVLFLLSKPPSTKRTQRKRQQNGVNGASTKTWRQRRHQNGVNEMQRRRKCGNSRASTKMRRQQGVDEDAASKGHRHTAEWAPVRWSIHRRKTSWRRRLATTKTTDEDASTTSSRVPSIRARRSSSSSPPSSVAGDGDDFGVLMDSVNPDIHGSGIPSSQPYTHPNLGLNTYGKWTNQLTHSSFRVAMVTWTGN